MWPWGHLAVGYLVYSAYTRVRYGLPPSVLPVVLLAVTWNVIPRKRRLYAPLAVGYLAHIAADAIYPVLTGDFYYVGFVGWPVIPPIEYPTTRSFLAHLTAMEPTPWFITQLLLLIVGTIVWIADGAPGFTTVRSVAKLGRERIAEILPG